MNHHCHRCCRSQPARLRLARALYGPSHSDGLHQTQAQLRLLAAERWD